MSAWAIRTGQEVLGSRDRKKASAPPSEGQAIPALALCLTPTGLSRILIPNRLLNELREVTFSTFLSTFMPASPPLPIIFGIPGLELEPEWTRFFQKVTPFGFILFARNLRDPEQARRLVGQLREVCDREEVAILIDEEGGRVQRLPKPPWPTFPAARALAQEAEAQGASASERVRDNYLRLGGELQQLGITVNAAPVADLALPGAHQVIGDRAFSSDPLQVAELARACAEGLRDAGVMPIVKHLPGYGRAQVDPHEELPVVREAEAFLQQSDFLPFQHLADLPWGMTSHLLFPQLDPEWPVTLSPTIISRVIREWIGFDGLLVTDCLFMKALSGTVPERVQRCLEAGCDLALHSHGELPELQEAALGLQPISDRSWDRWERARAWLKERS